MEQIENVIQTPPLVKAVLDQDPEKVKFLCRIGCNVDGSCKPYMETPLICAFRTKSVLNMEIVELLIKHGANVNATDKMGRTPLMYAAGRSKRGTDFLVQHGADIHHVDNDGKNVIRFYTHRIHIIRYFYKLGIDIDLPNKYGTTPLEYAVNINNLAAVKFFYATGANIFHTDDYGRSAIAYTRNKEMRKFLQSLKDKRVLPLRNLCISAIYALRVPHSHIPEALFHM